MKTKEPVFNVPFAVFTEHLPKLTRNVLIYLFSISDFSGKSVITYDSLMAALDIGSRNTVATVLLRLEKKGWFFHRKKLAADGQAIFLQIPPRLLTKALSGAHPLDIIHICESSPNHARKHA